MKTYKEYREQAEEYLAGEGIPLTLFEIRELVQSLILIDLGNSLKKILKEAE